MQSNKKGREPIHWTLILVRDRKGAGRRESTDLLRRAMIQAGFECRCAWCKCGDEWQGRRLVLQIDHADGDAANNERDNLRFLCPNCHSQTPNYGSKNIGRLTEIEIDELYAWG